MSTEFKLYNIEKKDLYVNKTPEEKELIRIKAVEEAVIRGNKPTARKYGTYPSSIRNWRKIYEEKGIDGLKRKC